MKVTELSFVAVPVTDVARARNFYEKVLGLKMEGEFLDGRWIEYDLGGATLAIANVNIDWRPSDQGTSAALEVDDFNAAISDLKRGNVTFDAEPFETPVCHMAVIKDPDGNKLIIHKRKSA